MAGTSNGNTRTYTRADWTDFDHAGPGALAGRYLRMFWQPVYRSQHLPAGAVPIRIMGEDFTLYRGERPHPSPLPEGEGTASAPPSLSQRALPEGEGTASSPTSLSQRALPEGEGTALPPPSPVKGEGTASPPPSVKGAGTSLLPPARERGVYPTGAFANEGVRGHAHLVAFRCAHRGTQLSTGWVEGDALRCFYHGWTYGPDGQCIEQPAEPEPFCQRIGIRSYPVEEYLGLIFAYLGEGEPPPLPRYPDFEAEGVRTTSSYLRACSFFNSIENGVDPAHLAFVHRRSAFADNGLVDVPSVSGEETAYGVVIRAQRPGAGARLTHHIMPNILHIKSSPDEAGSGWTDAIAWRVPLDDEQHLSFNVNLVHVTGEAARRYGERERGRPAAGPSPVNDQAARILAGELHIDDLGQPPYIVGVQDTVAQVGQGALADREHEHLGRSDITIILLRSIWARELQALAEGGALKRWTRPERVEATAGV